MTETNAMPGPAPGKPSTYFTTGGPYPGRLVYEQPGELLHEVRYRRTDNLHVAIYRRKLSNSGKVEFEYVGDGPPRPRLI